MWTRPRRKPDNLDETHVDTWRTGNPVQTVTEAVRWQHCANKLPSGVLFILYCNDLPVPKIMTSYLIKNTNNTFYAFTVMFKQDGSCYQVLYKPLPTVVSSQATFFFIFLLKVIKCFKKNTAFLVTKKSQSAHLKTSRCSTT